jgi:hypothetical protein
MKKASFGVILLGVLTACTTTYQPLPPGYAGPTVMIVDTMDPIFSARAGFFQLVAVDARRVLSSSASTGAASAGQAFLMDQRVESRVVPAGSGTLMIEARIRVAAPIMALSGAMYQIDGVVDVELEPDQACYVRGFLSEDYALVWLEGNSGQRVTRKVETGSTGGRLRALIPTFVEVKA